MKVSLAATVRLLPCDLEATDSNPETAYPLVGGKDAYIYSLQTPPNYSLV
jgi:hypothetical protein